MKNLFKQIGFIVLMAMIVFSFTTCDLESLLRGNDDDDDDDDVAAAQTATYTGTSDGVNYTLKITEDTARYTAQKGDSYVLTAGSKKSQGKVSGVSGSELTLKPSNATTTFTATVSGNGLTSLDGTITWSDKTTDEAPGALTGGTIDGDTDNNGTTDGTGSGPSSLSLSGKVYTREINLEGMMSGSGNMWIYEPYTGADKTFSSNVGGTGKITNGNLSFSVGTPSDSLLEPFKFEPPSNEDADIFGNIYSDGKCVPSDAKGVSLDFDIDLMKENFSQTMNMDTTAISTTIEIVFYTYVDRNCTVTASGGTITQESITLTYPNLNISYKKGWNTMTLKSTATTSTSGSNVTATGTVSITAGDSSNCKWVLDEDF